MNSELALAEKVQQTKVTDAIDEQMGFPKYYFGPPKVGWLVNFQPCVAELTDSSSKTVQAAVDFYFLDEEGGYFKSQIHFDPYFYVQTTGREGEVVEYLEKSFPQVKSTLVLEKEDLSLPNHLVGKKRKLIKIVFSNMVDLLNVRKPLQALVKQNKQQLQQMDEEELMYSSIEHCIKDVREHDVPYHVRVMIDLDLRVGKWYKITPPPTTASSLRSVQLQELSERVARADPVVLAYDIETTKEPLKFPDANTDVVMMISYMIDGAGYLIINREVVGNDIEDFEYTPKPELSGSFTVFNMVDERETLLKFFDHIKEEKPTVIATYNGDFFDWPFVCTRARLHNIDMYEEIGFAIDAEEEFKSAQCVHMDCFKWVQRDSYLPQGSQGLKMVTAAKLGYNPLEVDPEEMVKCAMENPQKMAEYSVSDAVATYYLYMKYVHPFIFSLCTILPLRPDEVLRKGTGTLCEMLLMVQAFKSNILLPQKHIEPLERYYRGHMVESETYVGGHVEALEAGVFRNDIKTKFEVDTNTLDQLISQLDDALKFTVVTELQMSLDDIDNFEEVHAAIKSALESLKSTPHRNEEPLIYHVDVASMYPNIMTSNRLQPDSMKTPKDCAMCDLNYPNKTCDRKLPWAWRVEYYPAQEDDIRTIRERLVSEKFPKKYTKTLVNYESLEADQQAQLLKERIIAFSKGQSNRKTHSETVEREAIICQKENPFYVNTVRDFRDRRYEFKGLQKQWKIKASQTKSLESQEEAQKMVILYDSMQLAHKVILNSFYGYVMRKGSRWYSMEMAGVTCLTGATIIQLARSMVEKLGRPLELDTDGIWCILPKSFPGDFSFKTKTGKKISLAYPCVMLNHLVHEKFTNHQYHTLIDPVNHIYEQSSDNTIFFEVDGPYKAMMLPSSLEEGKGLKKRYAVYNEDGSLAELKGFELKRRGELELIKTFQHQLFDKFLEGDDLTGCYQAVANVANQWLDVIDFKGANYEDVDLLNLICENKSMSKSLAEYGMQKSTSITTARRLGEFLGPEMINDKNKKLNCRYIISAEPSNEPVTTRAIPVQIFDAPMSKRQYFLRRWLKRPGLQSCDPREIIDWNYYRERLAGTILRLLVIPAARQGLPNPVPRVPPPNWLARRLAEERDVKKQQVINFARVEKPRATQSQSQSQSQSQDIESLPSKDTPTHNSQLNKLIPRAVVHKRKQSSTPTSTTPPTSVDTVHIPDIEKDYRGWVSSMKHVWKTQKIQYESRKQLFGELTFKPRGFQSLIQKQIESIWENCGGTWTIIKVSPGKELGKVRCAVRVNQKIQHVDINVPKIIYVLIREGHDLPSLPDSVSVTKSNAFMPSGQKSKNLYKVSMSEQFFKSESVKASGFLKSRSVEQVFEMNINSCDRLLIELGLACKVSANNQHGIIGRGLERGFDMKWLEPAQLPDDCNFLGGFDFVMVHHFIINRANVAIVYTSWGNTVDVIECSVNSSSSNAGSSNQSGTANDMTSALIATLQYEYKSHYTHFHPESVFFDYPPELKVSEWQKPHQLTEFYQLLTKKLNQLTTNKPNLLALVQSDRGLNSLSKFASPLSNLPTVDLGPVSTPKLNAIGWHPMVLKSSIKQFLRTQSSLAALQSTSMNTCLPIGNTPSGIDLRLGIDFAFARELQKHNHVLWWQQPVEEQNQSEIISELQKDFENEGIPILEVGESSKGVYRQCCLDIRIGNLVPDTIVQSFFLSVSTGFDLADPLFTSDAFSPTAWSALSQMIKDWFKRAIDSEFAGNFIEQLNGWFNTKTSPLYSPLLTNQVRKLTNRAVHKLVAEMKKLETSLVYCSSGGQHIILKTSKRDCESAQTFGRFLRDELKRQDLFMYINFEIVGYWTTLVWLDGFNYGGVFCKSELECEEINNWQIAERLPSILQTEFEEQVMLFIASNSSDYVAKESHKLSYRVKEFHKNYNLALANGDEDLFKLPVLASPPADDDNPILMFVKCLLMVLSLNGEITEITKLRRTLLNIVHVGDFDKRGGIFAKPKCLFIKDVVCSTCMDCLDVDICHPETSMGFVFQCDNCGSDLDRLFLEGKIVQMLLELVSLYQMQDFVCMKCGKVRPSDMAEHCSCSGKFRTSLREDKLNERLELFRYVCHYYDLRMLGDALQQLY